MLAHIHIQNYILVKNLSIDFENGLNILTGETGAGKSLWMDAVMIALGARTDASIIRHDATVCSITVSFDITQNTAAQQWLTEQDIPFEQSCMIRRCVYKDRASKTTINDQPCTQQNVKTLAPLLLSIHGQHHHQFLLKSDAHRQVLDTFANNETLLNNIATLVKQYDHNAKQIDQLKSQTKHQQDQLALLRFHLEEIETLNLTENEWQDIGDKHQRLHHAQNLIEDVQTTLNVLQNNDNAILSQIDQAQNALTHASHYDEQLNPLTQLLDEARINLSEAYSELSSYTDKIDTNPQTLIEVEQRLTTMHNIARKHHIEPKDILAFATTLQQQIDQLENADSYLAALEQRQQQLLSDYQIVAAKLTQARQKTAKKLQKLLTADMQLLGMEGGIFEIALQTLATPIHKYGQESIVFKVSTNPGQPLLPLQDIVSGGELSRISLALHRHLAQKQQQPTLIFDEVDTGIGGKTADKVGALLKDLSQQYQILCITHLPQIASLANQHFKAEKSSTKTDTETTMRVLDHEQRIEELSRMLGGTKVTKAIREHAEQLLAV